MPLSPQHALSEVRKNFTSFNWWRNRVFVPFVIGTATRLHPRYPGYEDAISVMDQSWDNLIVLDACRADFFEEVADLTQYNEYERVVSLGSHSSEWTRRNFQGKEYADTVYVSANPHTSLEAGDSFHEIYELWNTDFDEEAGVVRPGVVRDTAINAYKKYSKKKLIIHFMQPHGPFIGSEIDDATDETDYWAAYRENLHHVLPYVEELIKTIPGRTVITADHGQAYAGGIKGLLGIGGHKPRLRFPSLVYVPWAVHDAPRRETQKGEVTEASGESVQERLEDLGYL